MKNLRYLGYWVIRERCRGCGGCRYLVYDSILKKYENGCGVGCRLYKYGEYRWTKVKMSDVTLFIFSEVLI